ncbi:hypothetical protein Tco_1515264 [Tanacetum coccineum]
MEVIPDEEEVAIDVVPLATKVFRQMLKSFTKEDLEDLYKLIKAKYESTRPVEDLDLGRTVRIKSFLMLFGVTAALIDVNAAQSKLVLLENFNENYSKCLRLLVKLQLPVQSYYCWRKLLLVEEVTTARGITTAEGVNAASKEVSTAELVSTAYMICVGNDQHKKHVCSRANVNHVNFATQGHPHMTWKEKKAMENRNVVSLGGKYPIVAHVARSLPGNQSGRRNQSSACVIAGIKTDATPVLNIRHQRYDDPELEKTRNCSPLSILLEVKTDNY